MSGVEVSDQRKPLRWRIAIPWFGAGKSGGFDHLPSDDMNRKELLDLCKKDLRQACGGGQRSSVSKVKRKRSAKTRRP